MIVGQSGDSDSDCGECDGDTVLLVVCHADDHEYRLIRDLLRNYDRRLRPLMNATHALNVTFGLALSQIIDVVSEQFSSSVGFHITN